MTNDSAPSARGWAGASPDGSLAIWKFYDRPLNQARAHWVASRQLPFAPPSEFGEVRMEPAGP